MSSNPLDRPEAQAHIEQCVAAAPPLTARQRDEIATILHREEPDRDDETRELGG